MPKYLDPFLILLLMTVAMASFFPCHGSGVLFFNNLAVIAIALMFFLQGARLSRQAVIEGIFHWRLHLLIFACTFVIFPILGLGLHYLFPKMLLPDLWMGILFLCCLPSTVQSSIAFTSIAKGNVPAAICSATASNILGIFITPFLVGLIFSNHHQAIFSRDNLNIVYQLLLPFIMGQILQPWIREWALRNSRLLSCSDRGSILIVVYTAFSQAVNMGLWYKLSLYQFMKLILIDVVLLDSILIISFLLSKLFKFCWRDQISIVFCGSKKSLASGVPIANVLLPPSMVGMIILPLMIFHQIQLFVIAIIAQYCNKISDKKKVYKT